MTLGGELNSNSPVWPLKNVMPSDTSLLALGLQ